MQAEVKPCKYLTSLDMGGKAIETEWKQLKVMFHYVSSPLCPPLLQWSSPNPLSWNVLSSFFYSMPSPWLWRMDLWEHPQWGGLLGSAFVVMLIARKIPIIVSGKWKNLGNGTKSNLFPGMFLSFRILGFKMRDGIKARKSEAPRWHLPSLKAPMFLWILLPNCSLIFWLSIVEKRVLNHFAI